MKGQFKSYFKRYKKVKSPKMMTLLCPQSLKIMKTKIESSTENYKGNLKSKSEEFKSKFEKRCQENFFLAMKELNAILTIL